MEGMRPSTGLLSEVGMGRKESRMTPRFLNWATEWTVVLKTFRHVELCSVCRASRWRSPAGFVSVELR